MQLLQSETLHPDIDLPYYILCVCLTYHTQHKSSINHANTNFDTLCIFIQTGLPRRVDAMTQLLNYTRKLSLSQGHNITQLSYKNKPKVDNFVVAYLHSYPPSCTAASWDDNVKCFSLKCITKMYGQHGHRIIATLLLLFCALSN